MKIRCKKCYHVLKPQEEYCTSCGEHSSEIEQLMKTGYIEVSEKDKLKTALFIYLFSAIIGNGVYMIILGILQKKATNAYVDLFCQSHSLLISSIITLLIYLILYRKELKDMIITGTGKQIASSMIIGVLLITTCILFSLLSEATRVLPINVTNHLSSGSASVFGEGDTNVFKVMTSFALVAVSQEIVFRRRVIDALDGETLWGETAILIGSALLGTFLDLMWVMSINTLIVSLIMNLTLSGIYMYTNRNVGVTILIRILLVISIVVLYYK